MQLIENTAVKFSIPDKLADQIHQQVEKCEIVGNGYESKKSCFIGDTTKYVEPFRL